MNFLNCMNTVSWAPHPLRGTQDQEESIYKCTAAYRNLALRAYFSTCWVTTFLCIVSWTPSLRCGPLLPATLTCNHNQQPKRCSLSTDSRRIQCCHCLTETNMYFKPLETAAIPFIFFAIILSGPDSPEDQAQGTYIARTEHGVSTLSTLYVCARRYSWLLAWYTLKCMKWMSWMSNLSASLCTDNCFQKKKLELCFLQRALHNFVRSHLQLKPKNTSSQ